MLARFIRIRNVGRFVDARAEVVRHGYAMEEGRRP